MWVRTMCGIQDAAWLVLVEVRRAAKPTARRESVNWRKQAKLRTVAEAYVQQAAWTGPWRIDVVAVQVDGSGAWSPRTHPQARSEASDPCSLRRGLNVRPLPSNSHRPTGDCGQQDELSLQLCERIDGGIVGGQPADLPRHGDRYGFGRRRRTGACRTICSISALLTRR